jgi:hypothetical protein
LRDEIERRFGVTLHERSVGKVLAKIGYHHLSGNGSADLQETSPRPLWEFSPVTPKANRLKSVRIGQQVTLTRV